MPLPEWAKRIPGKQSLAKRLRANLLNVDLIRPFGPPGTTSSHKERLDAGGAGLPAHGLAKPDAPLGHPPRTDQWNDNGLVEPESNVAATRPRHSRQRGDLAR